MINTGKIKSGQTITQGWGGGEVTATTTQKQLATASQKQKFTVATVSSK
jgi:hypothetical protein